MILYYYVVLHCRALRRILRILRPGSGRFKLRAVHTMELGEHTRDAKVCLMAVYIFRAKMTLGL